MCSPSLQKCISILSSGCRIRSSTSTSLRDKVVHYMTFEINHDLFFFVFMINTSLTFHHSKQLYKIDHIEQNSNKYLLL